MVVSITFMFSYVLMRWASMPVTKTLQVQSNETILAVSGISYSPVTIGPLSVHVPKSWLVDLTNTDRDKIHALISAPSPAEGQIGITTAPAPHDGLQGVADYNFRHHTKDRYLPEEKTINDRRCMIFHDKQEPTTSTCFISEKGYYISITVSKMPSKTEADQILNYIAANYTWL